MARPKKRAAGKVTETAENAAATESIKAAIAFVAQAQKGDGGNMHQSHLMMASKWAWAFDGLIAAAHPILDENVACPHTALFLDALRRVGAGLTITQTAAHMTVADAKYRAIVPCVGFSEMPNVSPDGSLAPITDAFKDALAIAGRFSKESAPRIVEASLLLGSGSVTGTNGHVLIEAWHGIDMPVLVIPKAAANLIVKQTKKLASFGYSARTFTLYYEDGAWLRTQLYAEPWPNLAHIWAAFDPSIMHDLPADFFDACAAVAAFSHNSSAYLSDDVVSSSPPAEREQIGATYLCKGLKADCRLNPEYLTSIKDVAKKAYLGRDGQTTYLLGDAVRVALARIQDDTPANPPNAAPAAQAPGAPHARPAPSAGTPYDPGADADIPF